MIIKPLTNMRYEDRLWKEREMRAELAHEDRSRRNREIMRNIWKRREIMSRNRLEKFQRDLQRRRELASQ